MGTRDSITRLRRLFGTVILITACSAEQSVPELDMDAQDAIELGEDAISSEDANEVDVEPDLEEWVHCLSAQPTALDLGLARPNETLVGTVVLENCGDAPLTLTAIELEPSSGFTVEFEPAELEVQGQVALLVRFTTASIGEFVTNLRILADDVEASVELRAKSSSICARAVAGIRPPGAEPGFPSLTELVLARPTSLQVDSSASWSPAGEIVAARWLVVSQPAASPIAVVHASRNNPVYLTPYFEGEYTFELQVQDEVGHWSCNDEDTRTVRVRVESTPDFIAELSWSGDLDPFAPDFDLHYLHPSGRWNQAPYDIFWRNRTADWEAPGPADDPSLHHDSAQGGTEVLTHNLPSRAYQVGVYGYALRGGEPAEAHLRLWAYGFLVHESSRTLGQGEFWHVAQISWPTAAVTIVDELHTGFPAP